MRRRVALKQLTLVAGGLLTVPTWANAWTKTTVQPPGALLSSSQSEILTHMVDTLIPASDTPGAKELGVAEFVQKMIADCYEEPVQQRFRNGLDAVDAVARESYNQPFLSCDNTQRTAVLQKLEAAPETDRKAFYSLFKNLTIQGYTTSEYVMTKFLNYNPIPGHYYGCVPVVLAKK